MIQSNQARLPELVDPEGYAMDPKFMKCLERGMFLCSMCHADRDMELLCCLPIVLAWLNHLLCLETPVYAGKIEKFAELTLFGSTKQPRKIAITDKAIYNIKNYEVKRRIKIEDIAGLTKCVPKSKDRTEFTIHVEREHDYRYSSEK